MSDKSKKKEVKNSDKENELINNKANNLSAGLGGVIGAGIGTIGKDIVMGQIVEEDSIAEEQTGDNLSHEGEAIVYEATIIEEPKPQEVEKYIPETVPSSQIGFMVQADALSFNQAFANAREKLGAGAVFEWKNEIYNTFYAEEWEGKTAMEQQAFFAEVQEAQQSNAWASEQSEPPIINPIVAEDGTFGFDNDADITDWAIV